MHRGCLVYSVYSTIHFFHVCRAIGIQWNSINVDTLKSGHHVWWGHLEIRDTLCDQDTLISGHPVWPGHLEIRTPCVIRTPWNQDTLCDQDTLKSGHPVWSGHLEIRTPSMIRTPWNHDTLYNQRRFGLSLQYQHAPLIPGHLINRDTFSKSHILKFHCAPIPLSCVPRVPRVFAWTAEEIGTTLISKFLACGTSQSLGFSHHQLKVTMLTTSLPTADKWGLGTGLLMSSLICPLALQGLQLWWRTKGMSWACTIDLLHIAWNASLQFVIGWNVTILNHTNHKFPAMGGGVVHKHSKWWSTVLPKPFYKSHKLCMCVCWPWGYRNPYNTCISGCPRAKRYWGPQIFVTTQDHIILQLWQLLFAFMKCEVCSLFA